MAFVDTDLVLRKYLKARTPIGVTTLLFASANLPKEYDLNQGPCHLFTPRSDGSLSYDNAILTLSYQFRTYAETERVAREEALALVPVLNDAKSYQIQASRLEAAPQLLNDPETEWPYALSFYSIMFLNP